MNRDGLLDLNEALQHPGTIIAVDLSTDMPEEADLDLVKPVEGWLEAVSTGNLLLVTGEFTARCVLECARCGHPIEQEIKFEMSEEFDVEGVPSSYSQEGFARVVDDEPFPIFHENSLIVENLVRQDLILNLPAQPLCEFGWDQPCPNAERFEEMKRLAKLEGSPFANLRNLGKDDESPSE